MPFKDLICDCDHCEARGEFDDWEDFYKDGWIVVEAQLPLDDDYKEFTFCSGSCLSTWSESMFS